MCLKSLFWLFSRKNSCFLAGASSEKEGQLESIYVSHMEFAAGEGNAGNTQAVHGARLTPSQARGSYEPVKHSTKVTVFLL